MRNDKEAQVVYISNALVKLFLRIYHVEDVNIKLYIPSVRWNQNVGSDLYRSLSRRCNFVLNP